MRIVILSLFSLLLIKAPALSQAPSKREMQEQMLQVEKDLKKQIAELVKQIETTRSENPGDVKYLEEQLVQLRKHLATIEAANRRVPGMPTPKTDVTKIKKTLPGTIEPVNIDKPIRKTDDVKLARNEVDLSKIDICIATFPDFNLSPPSTGLIYEPLPKIKPNGELEYPSSRKDALSLDTRYMWNPGETITVGMDLAKFNTSAFVASKVEQYAKVWETVANIHFKFIPDYTKAYVRIEFDLNKGHGSMTGKEVFFNLDFQHTMNLKLSDEMHESTFKRNILHEFGHVLGFIHEHQSPAGGIQWNELAVFAYYFSIDPSWTMEKIRAHVIKKYSSTITNSSIYDPTSIMQYSIPPEFTLDGYSVAHNFNLSKMDSQFARMVYPHPYDHDNAAGTLVTGDDCDSIDFKIEYYLADVDPNFIDFILEPGTNQQGKAVTWWKRIGIPLKGGFEMDLEIINGSVSNKKVQVDLIDKARTMSFSKAKFLGIPVLLNKKWDVFPALKGGCRVRLTWRNDTCP